MALVPPLFQPRWNDSKTSFADLSIIYTVIIGEVDQPCSLVNANLREFHPYLITDSNVVASKATLLGWSTIIDITNNADAILISRYYKMHPHVLFPLSRSTLYVDGNIEVSDLYSYSMRRNLRDTIVLSKHPYRVSPLDEVLAFAKAGTVPITTFAKSLFLAITFESPIKREDIQLCEMNVIYCCMPSYSCQSILDLWWILFNISGSTRDQHVFPIAVLLSGRRENVCVDPVSNMRIIGKSGLYLNIINRHRGRYSNFYRKLTAIPFVIFLSLLRTLK